MKHLKYSIVIEKSKNRYGAYVIDLPGCIAVANTKREVVKLIKEGIEFHIEGLLLSGYKIPLPESEIIEFMIDVA